MPAARSLSSIAIAVLAVAAAGCGGGGGKPAPTVDEAARAAAEKKRADGAQEPVRQLIRALLVQDPAGTCDAFELDRISAELPDSRLVELCELDSTELFDPDDGLPLEGLDATLPIGFSVEGRKISRTDPDSGEERLRKVSVTIADRILDATRLQTARGRDEAGLYRVFAGDAPSDGVSVGYFDGVAKIASLDPVEAAEDLKLAPSSIARFRACLTDSGGRGVFDRGLPDQEEFVTETGGLLGPSDGAEEPVGFDYDETVEAPKDATVQLVQFVSAGAALRAYKTLKLLEPGATVTLLRLGSLMFISANTEERSSKIPAAVLATLRSCAEPTQKVNGPRNLSGPTIEESF